MKHSETFTLRKWNILKWKHETLRNSNPQKNGHEQFSNGNVRNFDPQKNENENSHPQMHAVCRSGEKTTNQHFEEFHERMHICLFSMFDVVCCARENKSVSFTIKATHFPMCVVFFPNVWLCVVRMRKTRGIKWTSGCFSKGSMTWCQLLIFLKQKHVQFTINKWNSSKQKQEQCSFVNVFDGPRGFLNEKSLWYFAFWNSLTPSEKFWFFVDPFSKKKCRKLIYRLLFIASTCIKKWTCMWNTTAWILDTCKLVHA